MTTHKEALKQAYDVFCGMSMDDEFSDMEAAIRAYMEAREVVMVPRERIEKLLEYENAEYVPNVLFDQFRQFAAAATTTEPTP